MRPDAAPITGCRNEFYLNDPVLAIQSLRRNGSERVAHIDIDAHHPDGVAHAFADDPSVLMISVHEENRWPRAGALAERGAGQIWNVPVRREFHDDEMDLIRYTLVLPLVAASRLDAIVLQCGVDAVADDPQSGLALSNSAHWAVVRGWRERAPRFLVMGGGGCNPWSVGRLWTGIWAVLAWHAVPEHLPLVRRAVLEALVWQKRGRSVALKPHCVSTLCDAPRRGAIRGEVRDRVARPQARMLAVV